MNSRKAIMYDILVEYYKEYYDKPTELISRAIDFHYNLEVAIVYALNMVKEINRSKKKLLRVTGYTYKDLYGIDAPAHSATGIRKDIYGTLNKWLSKCDFVHMTFSYADNKLIMLTINKTKHNHLRSLTTPFNQ